MKSKYEVLVEALNGFKGVWGEFRTELPYTERTIQAGAVVSVAVGLLDAVVELLASDVEEANVEESPSEG